MASSKAAAKVKSENRLSGKFTFRQDKKKKRSKDKLELEDSGVHLEEPGSGAHSGSCESQDDLDRSPDLLHPSHAQTSKKPASQQMSQHKDNNLSKPFSRHSAVSAPDLASRISKSESPQPPSRHAGGASKQSTPTEQFPPLAGTGIPRQHLNVAGNPQRYSTHNPETRPYFTLDSDSDETDSKSNKSLTKNKENRSREKSSNKGRFKKALKPLRRSHSAGSTKDVPAHALFLRYDGPSDDKTPPGRRSVDTGRGSMERGSDDSDSDQERTSTDSKSATPSTKAKKKTIAQDMKEKFAFLRRRPTDTSLSGKDGKPPKPTKEMVINWTQSFDNLLKDKVGLEWFKDFLGTEFSEENVEFWIACEEYKSIKPNKLNARAQEIFTDFVAVQAPREINLDSKTRMATKDLMEKPNRETFEIAQKRIQALMDKDSYPRFLRSERFQKLLSDYKIQLSLT